jgi:hypothetical protein
VFVAFASFWIALPTVAGRSSRFLANISRIGSSRAAGRSERISDGGRGEDIVWWVMMSSAVGPSNRRLPVSIS